MFRVNSVRFKMTALYVVILGLILSVFSAVLYASLYYTLYRELDLDLEGKANEVAAIIETYAEGEKGEAGFRRAIHNTIVLEKEGPREDRLTAAEARWLRTIDLYDMRQDFICILQEDGKLFQHSDDFPPGLPAAFSNAYLKSREQLSGFSTIRSGQRPLRVVHAPHDFKEHGRYVIQVGASLKSTMHILDVRLISILISIPVILAGASFIGRIFASRILDPVLAITKTAQQITHEDLSARVKTKHADEEIRYLEEAFNGMISRLEGSFRYVGEFSLHVAHELKTPLAIIRGECELALRSERSPEEYRRALQVGLSEAERMIRVVEDMLLLTRLEYESEVFKFEPFDLSGFLSDIHERSKVLAEPKQVEIRLSLPAQPIQARGDQIHLRRLFLNLIDNAIKFSPAGAAVDIRLRQEGQAAEVSIIDRGLGISAENLPRVFDKFFHFDPRPENPGKGLGLGLSMAMSIAKAHQGAIEVRSCPGEGAVFTVVFPLH